MLLFAALPLQWFALASTPLGTGRLHQVAIFAFSAIVWVHYRLVSHLPAVRVAKPFLVANAYMLTVWAAIDLYNHSLPLGAVQEGLYVGVFIAIATYFYRVASGMEPGTVEMLRWAAPVACTVLLVAFAVSMVMNGVNPLAVLQKTVSSADPEIFQKQVFKSSFGGFGLDDQAARGNLRHEIFGAILLSMLVSTWAMRFGSAVTRAQTVAYRVFMTLGVVLLAVSLSRSIVIAAVVWPIIAFVRSMRSGQLSNRQIALAFGTVTGIGLLSVTGFGLVIFNRFLTDTTGYDARAQNYAGAVQTLKQHWLIGGAQTSGAHVSSHNFVVDNWLRAGIFVAIAALAIVILLVATWFRMASQLHHMPDWMTPVVAALALPLVRIGTSGGGLIPPDEWVALGFVFGILAYRHQQRLQQLED